MAISFFVKSDKIKDKGIYHLDIFGKRKQKFEQISEIDLNGTDKELIKPSDNLLEFAAGQYEDPKYKLGEHEWPALKRMLKKNNSIYDQ